MERFEKYYKVIWVDLDDNDCDLLKGPEDELKLLEMLRDDYNSSRYDKWVKLIAKEKVKKEDAEFFVAAFCSENIRRQFQSGKKMLEYFYVRKVGTEEARVRARIYVKEGSMDNPMEVLIYIKG